MFTLLRNKTVLTLVGLLVLGMALGQAHNRAFDAGRPLLLEDMTSCVLASVSFAANLVLTSGSHAVRNFRPRSSILRENAQLRRQVRDLLLENAALREAAQQNAALRNELGLAKSVAYRSITAKVISRKESTWFDTATIDRGRSSGIAKGDAVV